MLLERARAVAPAFTLTERTAPAIAAICRQLDGLPLALELAAAHARLLSADALLARLDQAVSSPRARDLPDRQSTIRATLDWSHDLLTLDEQTTLRRLAVFAGGFGLDAAEAVVGDDVDVFAALAGLVDQSMVLALPEPDARYRLLEPVRQYAAARLAASGEADAVADRHTDWVCALGHEARDALRARDQGAWLDLLDAEHANQRRRSSGSSRAGGSARRRACSRTPGWPGRCAGTPPRDWTGSSGSATRPGDGARRTAAARSSSSRPRVPVCDG